MQRWPPVALVRVCGASQTFPSREDLKLSDCLAGNAEEREVHKIQERPLCLQQRVAIAIGHAVLQAGKLGAVVEAEVKLLKLDVALELPDLHLVISRWQLGTCRVHVGDN
eukprot:scaffold27376_cov16-Prasinocladus_malaysianus.AAC.1